MVTDIKSGWLCANDVAERLAVPVPVVLSWMRKGKPIPDAAPVLLESFWIGMERVTREEWLAEFIEATNQPEG